jgi:ABC-type glycerol-3-phosphate transport system substrate-binding protein
MMLRKLFLIGLLVMALGVLPTLAQETTIRYFTFSAAPDHLEDLDTIVAAFEAENPGINVEVETAAFADYFMRISSPTLRMAPCLM